ncbi:hypothetical protein, partial [Escherichia coli]|uniref:hypothetical protein n=1 Tax=Escherichia coli TaxID=562 RepID=UPI00050ACF8D
TMIWQPEFTDKTLSRKPGAVQSGNWIIAFFAVLAFSVFFLVEYVLGLDGNKSIEILFLINMLFTVTN